MDHPLPRLGEFLFARRGDIIRRWAAAARREPDIPSAGRLTDEQLTDHLPKLFEELCRLLHAPDSPQLAAESRQSARAHGRHRWQQGYRLDEVVREIGLLRHLIAVDYLTDFTALDPAFDPETQKRVRGVIHRFFDDQTSSSVAQYTEEQQREIVRAGEELAQVNEQLRRVDASRQKLTRTVSHELGNTLNQLGMAAAIFHRSRDEEMRERMLEKLESSVAEMKSLLAQLLDYAVLISGRAQVRAEPVDLTRLCEELSFTFRHIAEAKGLAFSGACDPNLRAVTGDRLKLKQIASNLLSNAIKYTPAGEVRLVICPAGEEAFAVVVEDTGVGVAPQDVGRIFEEFERVETSAGVKGTGLGLAVTKGLVELLHGRIEVSSEVGKGSRFEVILPVRQGG